MVDVVELEMGSFGRKISRALSIVLALRAGLDTGQPLGWRNPIA